MSPGLTLLTCGSALAPSSAKTVAVAASGGKALAVAADVTDATSLQFPGSRLRTAARSTSTVAGHDHNRAVVEGE